MSSSILGVALVINELMASNAGSVMSPAINYDSWIEIYNPTEQAVNLSGMYLSDDADNLTLWQMPSNIGTVPAKGFLVVWLGSDDIKDNQAPFKLDCDGGLICLSDQTGQLVASMQYPEAMSRTAYARTVDGGNEWGWTAFPTPGATNATSVFASERLAPPVVSQGSKLFTGTLNVSVDIPEGATLMYTTDGSLPTAPTPQVGETTSPWTNWVNNSDCEGNDATCLIGKDGNGNGKMNTSFVDGVGHNNSRGIKVHAVANAAEDWTTQFFVYTPDHVWNAGDKYRFHMYIRADQACKVSVQSHKTPGNYIYWSMLNGSYNVTNQWTEISYEGTITPEQAGTSVGGAWGWGQTQTTPSELQTIAFNLNVLKTSDNNFYIDDITWESYQGEGSTPASSKKSDDGQFTISQTANYTFRLFRDGYLPSVPVTRSYIQTSNKYTFPVISIVGDKKHFTDPKTGIDCDGDGTNGKTGNGQNVPRNYNMPWNRPVNFSYIGTEGEMLFNQDVNISVSGGWTRSQSERSFKLKSSKIFDGQNRFDFSFFPQKPYIRSKALLVRNGGNDVWLHNARFMDPALQTIIQRSGIDVDVQSYVPIIEYVNGTCRGVLNLREPNNDNYVYANFGYDDEEIDMFENFQFNQGNDSVLKRIFDLGNHINDVGAYDELKQLLDIDEFTNYMAVEMFLGNDDWPDNNIKAYRSRNNGRYRFICFDLDYSFALRGDNNTDNPFTYIERFKSMQFVSFFLNLLSHDTYRKKFIDTYCIVAGSVFDKTRSAAIVDELADRLRPMLSMTGDNHSPDRAATTIKEKLKTRLNSMMTCMQQYKAMKLSGVAKQSVTLSASTSGATLLINGIEVPYAEFSGQLFAPVSLEAKAPAGYRFEKWTKNGAHLSTEKVIDLPSGSSLTLKACFTPLTDAERKAEGLVPVRINEVSAANGIYVNEFFKRNDWIELYNTTDADIDLEGMYLTDNLTKPQKYRISKTAGVSTLIPAHGHLIVWCDKLEAQLQLHAPFKLASEGGNIQLMAADGSWSDCISYHTMGSDETIGRYPDGSNHVITMNVPTIAKANITGSYASVVDQTVPTGINSVADDMASLSLHYIAHQLVIRTAATQTAVRLEICNLAGQSLGMHTARLANGYAQLSLDPLPSGCYIARVTDGQGHTSTCKFIKN